MRGNTLNVLKLGEKLAEAQSKLKKRKRTQDQDVEPSQAVAVEVAHIRDWCDSEGR
jgi:hypothetical protein